MDENKKELQEGELEAVGGGAGVYAGKRITTGISKGCDKYEKGNNFYNEKILAISGTCGACKHMTQQDGWHLCSLEGNY